MILKQAVPCLALVALAVACAAQHPSIQIGAPENSASGASPSCTSTPPEGTRATETRAFQQFESRLVPAEAADTPALDGRTAVSKAKELGMIPPEKAECTEVLYGLFEDPQNRIDGVPAWAVIVHTTKPWTMDVAHYWTECAKRSAACPTPAETKGVSPYQTVIVLDARTGAFIRHMESPPSN